MPKIDELLDAVKYDDKGLVTAVAQDWENGQVLMVAFMNREALRNTLERRVACYWSRSRGKLWIKGETSGHFQKIRNIYFDCDMDAVVMKIEQVGGACHTGYRSCFYREATVEGELNVVGEKVFDEGETYGKR
jgi:phosphoribosyl-AMP cyclohydrolase